MKIQIFYATIAIIATITLATNRIVEEPTSWYTLFVQFVAFVLLIHNATKK